MKPYHQTTFDPAATMFAIGIDKEGRQRSLARVDDIGSIRARIRDNFREGYRTEVAMLSSKQLECVIKRVMG